MTAELSRAAALLGSEQLTFAAVRGETVMKSQERGVKPLMKLISGGESLSGASAADKVIGKAAAFLYVLLSPKEIFAHTISRPALEVLQKSGIPVEYETLTEAIRNRTNTGFCPMESAVMDTDDPHTALELIRKKAAELAKK